ncbi:hypothetical protein [Bradyrhizobium elkanii]|uniref:Peptidase n=1 Tax=Bradyrhizobium elkanii TaxID=29448 RepID=A0ABV4F1A3_BRAEL|nr:hypothetical protein [Bradyrhizobium elkanii]MCP1758221.1 hypothetical protein [Bradyrhizobium elkanii]MCP1983537.1 hypothetical protein [Bradyrhizobium elkanii]MCS3881482.1 hypothetical protein [Bradyrhizobium elkanii]MCS4219466.1 hypothetical protein [Bradyrhizobium elkanii]MCW2200429.1 hypothetical protein [Bradyrhizobium elkanii]
MTIVVTVKINDGIVLAADSATTFSDNDGNVIKIYNTANKVFNLVKGLPIGLLTWGAGGVGAASIATLTKDLRRRLAGEDPSHIDWKLPVDYTIEAVASRVKEFFHDELYAAQAPSPNFFLGFKVCGYSAGAALPELWDFRIVGDKAIGPVLARGQDSSGPNWDGEYEAMDRLILGIGTKFKPFLKEQGADDQQAEEVTSAAVRALSVPVTIPAMPIKDAIELATFMVETTIRFVGFNMRAATVGEPVEVAAITKHEGFKWVKRKLFFHQDINP